MDITEYGDLKREIVRTFPSIMNRPFVCTYLDDDGDYCTVSCSEELHEGLRVAKAMGKSLKLYINLSEKGVTPSKPGEAVAEDGVYLESHSRPTNYAVDAIDPETLRWMNSRLKKFGLEKNRDAQNVVRDHAGDFSAAARSVISKIPPSEKKDTEDSSASDASSPFVFDKLMKHILTSQRKWEEDLCHHNTAKNQHPVSRRTQDVNDPLLAIVAEGEQYLANVNTKASRIVERLKTQGNHFSEHLRRTSKDIVRNAKSAGCKLQKRFLKVSKQKANKTYAEVLSSLRKAANDDFHKALRRASKDAKTETKDMRVEARALIESAKEATRVATVGAQLDSSSNPASASSCATSSDEEIVVMAKEKARAIQQEARKRKEQLVRSKRIVAKQVRKFKLKSAKEKAERARSCILESARRDARRVRHQVVDGVRSIAQRMLKELDRYDSQPESGSEMTGDDECAWTERPFQRQEEVLLSMGFEDRSNIRRALSAANGDIGRAVATLISE
eukprot:g741.t1